MIWQLLVCSGSIATNVNNKRSMRTEIIEILQKAYPEYCLKHIDTANEILRLFSVMESDCDHEWLNHSFDQFGFLQEQICDKCGAKQSVP